MAESFVTLIASSLLGTLASPTCEEISQVHGVYEDLQKLKDTLFIVRGLLLDAEKKKDRPHRLTAWLRQIQNICFDAEDVLDEFELRDKQKQVVKASGSKRMKVDTRLELKRDLKLERTQVTALEKDTSPTFSKREEINGYG